MAEARGFRPERRGQVNTSLRRLGSLTGLAALVLGTLAGPVSAREADRSETPVASGSPVTDVSESAVRVKVPLPASAGPHPRECDWLSYLRFRHKDGPAASAAADKILVAQPGMVRNPDPIAA
jgi:hypothetical protein